MSFLQVEVCGMDGGKAKVMPAVVWPPRPWRSLSEGRPKAACQLALKGVQGGERWATASGGGGPPASLGARSGTAAARARGWQLSVGSPVPACYAWS